VGLGAGMDAVEKKKKKKKKLSRPFQESSPGSSVV
jgi:hypothetical protein